MRGPKNPDLLRLPSARERARSSTRYSTPRKWGAKTIYAVIHQAWIQAMSTCKVSGSVRALSDYSSTSKATASRLRQAANDGAGEFGSRRLDYARFPACTSTLPASIFGSRIRRSTRSQ